MSPLYITISILAVIAGWALGVYQGYKLGHFRGQNEPR